MRWSDATDAALLAASRKEPDAFMAFYQRYESAVIGYMLRRTRSTELSVDLASEVFAETLASSRRYRPQSDSAAAWLFTIAHHVLTDSVRRGRVESRARRRIGIADAVSYSDDDLERTESLVSQSGWATRLLEGLPAEQRSAVHARIIEERSYSEIARDLKTSALVIRQRVSRGLSAYAHRPRSCHDRPARVPRSTPSGSTAARATSVTLSHDTARRWNRGFVPGTV